MNQNKDSERFEGLNKWMGNLQSFKSALQQKEADTESQEDDDFEIQEHTSTQEMYTLRVPSDSNRIFKAFVDSWNFSPSAIQQITAEFLKFIDKQSTQMSKMIKFF